MRETNFHRQPVRAAQRAKDVAEDGERAIVDLVQSVNAWLGDRITEHRYIAMNLQRDDLATVIQVLVRAEPAQGGLDVRRMPHRKAINPNDCRPPCCPTRNPKCSHSVALTIHERGGQPR